MSDNRATTQLRTGIPRWLEAGVASAFLIVAAPLFAALALGVRLSSAGPVLFRQERVGQGGRPFTMLKFRSMRVNGRGPQITATGDDRVTGFGRFLRRTKLDELPELWNVVRGDMALVGPRPEVPGYVHLDDPVWLNVLRSRPGVTDPVTTALRWEEELLGAVQGDRDAFYRSVLLPYKLDGYVNYLENRTFRSDLGVLWTTLAAICLPRPVDPAVLDRAKAMRTRRQDTH
jgi:lipopolysaccharide/colanic/teichoic acid biosynthesis glycosyltransferase